MDSDRDTVLGLIIMRGTATAKAISEDLGKARGAMVDRLRRYERDGLVRVVGTVHEDANKPTKVYTATDDARTVGPLACAELMRDGPRSKADLADAMGLDEDGMYELGEWMRKARSLGTIRKTDAERWCVCSYHPDADFDAGLRAALASMPDGMTTRELSDALLIRNQDRTARALIALEREGLATEVEGRWFFQRV